jgi:transposase
MPPRKDYTVEFKDQAVRFVFESIEPDESRREACERLGAKLNVKSVTLYNWVKAASPAKGRPAVAAGSMEELRAQVQALKRENRELARANSILQDAASFFGAALDRQSRR